MKIIKILLPFVLGALILGSCSKSDTKSSSPSVSATTSTTYKSTTTTSYSLYDAYIKTLRTRFPNSSDSALISLGETACATIDAYGSVSRAMVAIASDPRWSASEANNAGYVFGVAIPVFCPRYLPELNRIIN